MTRFTSLLCVLTLFSFVALVQIAAGEENSFVLLEDEFDTLRPGILMSAVGAHTEYHYLPESAPKGPWSISCFKESGMQRGWRAIQHEGKAAIWQSYAMKEGSHYHPMLVAGDPLWTNYRLEVQFTPQSDDDQSGIVFRYQNDRCYYFFGVDAQRAVLKLVQHATAFHKPYEKILAESKASWTPGESLTATVTVKGDAIRGTLSNGVVLEAKDVTYPTGKIALSSDVPAIYERVLVTTDPSTAQAISKAIHARQAEEKSLQDANPQMTIWKKISTEGFGVGRSLRFGDLDGDDQIDVLVGQVLNHGPKDRNSEVGCLTAMTFDGKRLWQIGEPDPWNTDLTCDVAFQIHDLDGDGKNEVIFAKDMELTVVEGSTGKTIKKIPTPAMPPRTPAPHNRYPRILGDAIFFCDLRGTGRDADIILKDRYLNFWALNENLEVMWQGQCNTGHYPYAEDIDADGRDEVMIGYSLYDDDGKCLWSLDRKIRDHADGVALVRFLPDKPFRLLCAASDEGMFFADMSGNILRHHYLGHVQNPAVANFRPDLPGLEAVSINFWSNQGIIHVYDASGQVVDSFEPCQHGSMCMPINWSGQPTELFVLSADVREGGLFDGWGRRAVKFPADGHPDQCYAVLDITGDCRDEIVVWDPHEVWVYTQRDNNLKRKLYRPVRNPLYNWSNYQATVSLPGWSDDSR